MSANRPRPPRLLTHLLGLWRLGPQRREVEADLEELFDERAVTRGLRHARLRYAIDVMSVGRRVPHAVTDRERFWRRPTGILTDIVYAARLFRRQPGIVGMTIAGLAVAIGLTTAVMTIVGAVAFRDTGIDDPDTIFQVEGPPWLYPDYLRFRDTAQSVTAIATAWGSGQSEFRDRSDADRGNLPTIGTSKVTGNYLQVLGARPALGRLLAPEDEDPGAPPVVVLAYEAWQTLLAGDLAVVGRTVWLGSRPHTVVGVTAKGFDPPGSGTPGAWMSLAQQFNGIRQQQAAETRAAIDILRGKPALTSADRERLKTLDSELVTPRPFFDQNAVLVRTRPGITRFHAEAELTAFVAALSSGRRQASDGPPRIQLRPTNEVSLSDRMDLVRVTMLAALLVVLACANVTNLLLASAAARRREIGTRLALGAGRVRIAQQLLTESLLLSGIGGATGFVLANWILPALVTMHSIDVPADVAPSPLVYVCAALFCVVVAVIAGLAPARLAWRSDVTSAVKADRLGSPSDRAPGRVRALLVGVQAAASIVLLIASALLVRSVIVAAGYDHGADLDRLLNVSLKFGQMDEASRTTYINAAIDRLRQMPGIGGVSRATFPPFFAGGSTDRVGANTPLARAVSRNFTSADYFDTIGATLLRGRVYNDEEVRTGAPVAVITHSLAKDFWPDENPIGASLERLWGPDDPVDRNRNSWARKPAGTRIVGVVQETTTAYLGELGRPTIYLPISTEVEAAERLIVRAAPGQDPEALVQVLHAGLRALDPDVTRAIDAVWTRFQGQLDGPRTRALMSVVVGLTALALAVVGLFGVTAFAVAQRRREVSVRVALGASGRGVVGLLVRDSLKPVVTGLACGIGLSFFMDRLIRVNVIGIVRHDPLAIASAAAVLLLVAAIAAFLPARHAARVNPAEMLKQS